MSAFESKPVENRVDVRLRNEEAVKYATLVNRFGMSRHAMLHAVVNYAFDHLNDEHPVTFSDYMAMHGFQLIEIPEIHMGEMDTFYTRVEEQYGLTKSQIREQAQKNGWTLPSE